MFSTLFLDVDARELCEAATSLKTLELTVEQGSKQFSTSEALAVIFDHKSLEELDLIPFQTVEVRKKCLYTVTVS